VRDLFFLTCGGFRVPAALLKPLGGGATDGAGSVTGRMTNTVAVVVRDGGDVVLVDAGWSREACEDPRGRIGRVRSATLGVRLRPGDCIAAQLEALGIPADRVTTIVATHLHLDHVGGVVDFPNAELAVSQRELDAYWKRTSPGYRVSDLARVGRIRALALDAGPTYGFPASADLFGDGEVVLLDARGHTAGSVGVALRGARGTYVHVGDAVYQSWEMGLSPSGPCLAARVTAWRRLELRRAYASLRACEADPRHPTIVPSHDAEVFARLPQRPCARENSKSL
jgi:glyoxylase-like metal-dependent hydrolase (beta-lactamase superfamily II)